MNKLLFFLLLFAVQACSNNNTTSTAAPGAETVHANAADTIVTDTQPIVLNGCYQMTMKRDTANLQLQLQDSTVTGHVTYQFYEKDRNEGTLKGVLRNNMILADYTFQSEGTTSVREVIFKIEGDTLLQGFGELGDNKGKIVFNDQEALQYQTDHPFIKVACQ